MHKNTHMRTRIFFLALGILNVFLWTVIVRDQAEQSSEISFLDVGQGDSTLVEFGGGVQMLVDAGSDRAVSYALAQSMPPHDRRIDMVMISHPQRDHFGGLADIINRYSIGVLIINGRMDAGAREEWEYILKRAHEQNVPVVVVRRGDRIRYRDARVDILSPDASLVRARDLNDTSIVARVQTPEWSALFTGDIGIQAERAVSRMDIGSDILKIPHHGSKYSSSQEFLDAVMPTLALIGVGATNRYGHPTVQVLDRLAERGVIVFRTDRNGSVRVRALGDQFRITTTDSR